MRIGFVIWALFRTKGGVQKMGTFLAAEGAKMNRDIVPYGL